jgi:hypothetical protein
MKRAGRGNKICPRPRKHTRRQCAFRVPGTANSGAPPCKSLLPNQHSCMHAPPLSRLARPGTKGCVGGHAINFMVSNSLKNHALLHPHKKHGQRAGSRTVPSPSPFGVLLQRAVSAPPTGVIIVATCDDLGKMRACPPECAAWVCIDSHQCWVCQKPHTHACTTRRLPPLAVAACIASPPRPFDDPP